MKQHLFYLAQHLALHVNSKITNFGIHRLLALDK